ncbi:MAG: Hsp20/alpha crystallin family protein [Chloroflexota bacterium]
MSIVRWDPFGELVTLREAMNRLLEDSFVRPSSAVATVAGGRLFPVDVYQTENEYVVKATLPGVKPEDVDISVSDGILTIKGEIKEEQEVKRENYLLQERRFGSFHRELTLPVEVEADKAEATFENGILSLKLPKAERVKPKTIKVVTKAGK